MSIFNYETFKVLFFNSESFTLLAMFVLGVISAIVLYIKIDMSAPHISIEQWKAERIILDKEEKERQEKINKSKYFKWWY